MLSRYGDDDELVAHDCALVGNPSHSGIDDLEREYPRTLRERLLLYHYGSGAQADALSARGYRVARSGEAYPLPAPPSKGSAA
jgi:hypothetical protein